MLEDAPVIAVVELQGLQVSSILLCTVVVRETKPTFLEVARVFTKDSFWLNPVSKFLAKYTYIA